jgi:hypothetical protein
MPTVATTVMGQLDEARATCRELAAVLDTENRLVTGRNNLPLLEEQLDIKRHLTLRLERLVQSLKTLKPEWENDRKSADAARRLAFEMGEFQRLAAKNMMQLRAAHQIRADVIALVQDTLQAQKVPLAYGKNGEISRSDAHSVMRKEI